MGLILYDWPHLSLKGGKPDMVRNWYIFYSNEKDPNNSKSVINYRKYSFTTVRSHPADHHVGPSHTTVGG